MENRQLEQPKLDKPIAGRFSLSDKSKKVVDKLFTNTFGVDKKEGNDKLTDGYDYTDETKEDDVDANQEDTNQYLLHHLVALELLGQKETHLLLQLLTTGGRKGKENSEGKHVSLFKRICYYFPHFPESTRRLFLFFFQDDQTVNSTISRFDRLFKKKQVIKYFISKVRIYLSTRKAYSVFLEKLQTLQDSDLVKYGPKFNYLTPDSWAKYTSTCLTAILLCGSATSFLVGIFATPTNIIATCFVNHTAFATFLSALSGLALPVITFLIYTLIYFAIFKLRSVIEEEIQVRCVESLEDITNYEKMSAFSPSNLLTLEENYHALAQSYDKSGIMNRNDEIELEPLKKESGLL